MESLEHYQKQIAYLQNSEVIREQRPILIGASYDKHDKKKDLKEKYGAINLDAYTKENIDIKNGYLDILYPELLGINWSVEINEAFIIGAVRSGRPIHLVTSPEYFQVILNNGGIIGNGCLWELVSLKECDYKPSNIGKGIIEFKRNLTSSEVNDDAKIREYFEKYKAAKNVNNNFTTLIENYAQDITNFASFIGFKKDQEKWVIDPKYSLTLISGAENNSQVSSYDNTVMMSQKSLVEGEAIGKAQQPETASGKKIGDQDNKQGQKKSEQ